MEFIKFLMALMIMCVAANATGVEPESKEVFLGVCMLLAGVIAHDNK